MQDMWKDLLQRHRAQVRFLTLVGLYSGGLITSLWFAWQLRFDFAVPGEFQAAMWASIAWIVPVKLVLLWASRQFAGLLSYFGIRDLFLLFVAVAGGAVVLLVVRWLDVSSEWTPTRGVILVDFVLSFVGLAGIRLFLRLYREKVAHPQQRGQGRMKRVAIAGAGFVGANLAKELLMRRGLGLNPVVFFDDDSSKWNSRVHDIPVVGGPELLLEEKFGWQLDELIIALPAPSARRIREVLALAQRARLKCETVPSMEELATGRVKVSQLRAVRIEDLLGREPVALETDNIRQLLCHRVVMVTGAGGSIGSELCRQIAAFNPQRLLLVERCEVQLFQIEQELIAAGHGGIIVPVVADLLDAARMRAVFTRFRPEAIFHAAAHKHVPMMEHQPAEAVKNNTLGTKLIAELAQEFGTGQFLLISTDKAINPTSVMGASKRLAEIFIQALHAQQPGGTRFVAVRFGNVLGSSGSVIPTFNRQIEAGGPVKVTHPEVTRYFMTIPEAVGLVLQSASQAEGGEIFVLDMGKPIKIVDLARQLIELHGLQPDADIEIAFTGLRPGEKLFEELSHHGENVRPTNHPKILRFVCTPGQLNQVREQFAGLEREMHQLEPDQMKLLIRESVPEYQPFLGGA